MKRLILILFLFIWILESCNYQKKDQALINFNKAKYEIKHKQYLTADSLLKLTPLKHIKYDSALLLRKECEKLYKKQQARMKYVEDSLYKIRRKKRIQEIRQQNKNYISELYHFNKTKEQFTYDIAGLLEEVKYFKNMAQKIDEFKVYNDKQINELSKRLKRTLIYRQRVEFPKIRKEYAAIIKKKLWVNDINVSIWGKRYNYLTFTGGDFAANKNKQDFETAIEPIATKFRFNAIKYKWYEDDDNPKTYYLGSLSDSDFDKF